MLDAFDGSHLFTKDFLDELYHATCGCHLYNASLACTSTSFDRGLSPILFVVKLRPLLLVLLRRLFILNPP